MWLAQARRDQLLQVPKYQGEGSKAIPSLSKKRQDDKGVARVEKYKVCSGYRDLPQTCERIEL
jgi:hypothetical protein